MKNRNKFLLSSITMAVLAMMDQAYAQEATDTTTPSVTRIEITGSAIKRADAETALPVTVIKADDFAKMGYTTIADVMQSLSVNAEVDPLAAAGGSVVNLRGLGLARTLVLLNGQRLANEPTNDTYANLEVLPMSALDRVEILRDGASSLYGSDAVAGVVNFITKKTYDGASLTVRGASPDRSGGANEEGFNVIGGKGNLEADGWSWYGTLDVHKQSALADGSRPEANNASTLASIGLAKATGTGSYAYPANILGTSASSKTDGNPVGASQAGVTNPCSGTYLLPGTNNTCNNNNNSLYAEFFPAGEQDTFFTEGQLKLGADNTLSTQISYGQEYRDTTKGAPMTSATQALVGVPTTPVLTLPYYIPGTTTVNPYYPGAGITPAIAGLAATKGVWPTLNLDWQDDPAGAAMSKDEQKNARIIVSDVGHFHNWDYTVNLAAAKDERALSTESGILNMVGFYSDVANGIINPFGAQNAAGAAALAGLAETGVLERYTTSAFDSLNFTASHDLWELPGGTMATTVGGDYRHDAMHDTAPPADALLGSIPSRPPYDVHASRDVASLFGELDLPVTKQLDADVAVRADDYSDVGSTVNPKVSLRYQPLKTLTLRSSYSTGFRAPSLIDSYGYPGAIKTTTNKWTDPELCNGSPTYVIGKPSASDTVVGASMPGGVASLACNQKQNTLSGSNSALTPEKSKNFTAGFVVDPLKNLSITVDYWHIRLTNTISNLSENTIFDNPAQFANNFVYGTNAAGQKVLEYVNLIDTNQGSTITSGEDLDVLYKLPKTTVGDFMVHLTGTYTNDYQFQPTKGSAWCQNVGQFGCGGLSLGSYSSGTNVMTFRWQHNLMLNWNNGPWAATIAEKYQSGYHDGTTVASQYYRDISSYSTTNLTGSYSGFKNVVISAGVQNLFDRLPPVTNTQATGLLIPYDSIVGREYILSATYKFF